jgi:hypothetical protein
MVATGLAVATPQVVLTAPRTVTFAIAVFSREPDRDR